MITHRQLRDLLADGGRVVDLAEEPLGRLRELVLDPQSLEPAWATVAVGPGRVVVVPMASASRLDGSLHLRCTAAEVRSAPGVEETTGPLSAERAELLARWWEGHPHDPAGPAFLLPGLGLPSGRHAPVAYPGTAYGPWPTLTSSWPGPPWGERRRWRWPSVLGSVAAMRGELRPFLQATDLPSDELDDLVLATSEAAVNAVEHAGSADRPFFDVLAEVGAARAGIVVQDHGRWRVRAAGENGGHGLHLIGVLADATFTAGARGTTVMLRNRPAVPG